jgi:hypothetical protein
MNNGSNIILITAPIIIEIIANFGFHSALIIEFRAIHTMKNGIHNVMIQPYVVAYGLRVSVHQNTVNISGRNTNVNQLNISEIIMVISIHVATHLAASSFFFSHNFILKKLAAQSQNNNAHQRHIIVNGNTIFVAQFAKYHIHLPMNI